MCGRNRILFVGYSCLDLVYVCNHFPIEDSDQRAKYNEWRRGGNASNNSTVFKQLLKWKSMTDIEVEYFGTVGDDFPTEYLINDFNENGIIIENIVRHKGSQCPSSSVLINDENGSRTIVHFNKNLPLLTFESFSKLCLERYKIIHFEGLRNPLEIKKMIQFIREKDIKREIKISVEFEKHFNELKVLLNEEIDIFFVEKEFAKIFGFNDSQQTVKGIAQLVHYNAIVVCPWAETGAKAIDNNNKMIYSLPAFQPKNGVIDTLGAGDTFVTATLFGLWILYYDLKASIELGCRVAGAKCGQYGYKHLHKFEEYF